MKNEVDRFNTFCAMLLTEGHTHTYTHTDTYTHKVIAINPWRGLKILRKQTGEGSVYTKRIRYRIILCFP